MYFKKLALLALIGLVAGLYVHFDLGQHLSLREHAGDLIAEYLLAMKQGIGLNKILGTINIYPTLAEANKYVAGNWKKAHAAKAASLGRTLPCLAAKIVCITRNT